MPGTSDADDRAKAITKMIASLKKGKPEPYFVSLVGYFIEGYPHSASGLALETAEILRTDDGFAYMTYFKPKEVQPATVAKCGVVKKDFGGELVDVVKVRVDVKAKDVWAISAFIEGHQYDLFRDPQTFVSRRSHFIQEMHAWFANKNATR